MTYSEILKEYIANSGKTLEQIVKECEDRGVTIHSTYISKLRLGQRPAPDDSISRVLAEVTGGDPEPLIAAGYIERAPEEVRGVISHYLSKLDSYTAYVAAFTVDYEKWGDMTNEEISKEISDQVQKIKNIPYEERIDFVINHYNRIVFSHPHLLKNIGEEAGIDPERINKTIRTIQEGSINRIKLLDLRTGEEGYEWVPTSKIRFGQYIYIIADDDSMAGAGINTGAKLFCQIDGDGVIDEDEGSFIISDGKIYALTYNEEVLIRRVFKTNTGYILQSENSKYPPITITAAEEAEFDFIGMLSQSSFH